MAYNWYYAKPRKKSKPKSSTGPRQRMKFGQTWWGKEWLNALTHIDYDNRLPRGRAYAGNGSVIDINTLGNTITAKVQGSQYSPYKIKITIPEFTPAQKEKLVNEIIKNPLILSNLLNREIPEELNRLALDHDIHIFPGSWKDFNMDCSCPDWAVPCKHLAAVIYIISNEIDANPFVLFNLRGIDLIATLQKYHNGIGTHAAEQIPAVESFTMEVMPPLNEPPDFSIGSLPDFTPIQDQTDKIFTLLPPKPLFSDKDFKPLLLSTYKKVAKSMKIVASEKLKTKLDPIARHIDSFDDTMILLDQNLMVDDICLTRQEGKTVHEERLSWDEFNNLLENLDPAVLENCNDALRGIDLHRQYAKALAARGAFIPQLLSNRDNNYLIRYIPSENEPGVKVLSKNMLTYAPSGTVWIWNINEKGEEIYMSVNPEENSRLILSAFLKTIITETQPDTKTLNKQPDHFVNLFFHDKPYKFDGLTEKQIPNTIQLWLKRLNRAARQWQPILLIEDKERAFNLEILAVDTASATTAPIPFRNVMEEKAYQSVRLDLLRDLSSLTEFLPELGFYLKSSGRQPMSFHAMQFVDVFQRILPTLRMLGIGIMMPKALEKLIIPKPSLRLTTKATGKTISFVNLHEMLGFDYQVAIGDQLLPVDAFRKLVHGLSGVVKIQDQYVLINTGDLEKVFKAADVPVKLSAQQLLKAALSESYEGATIGLDPNVRKLIKKLTTSDEIPLPKGILASFRPYQLTGYQWMARQAKIGFGSLIADDMGLGKTLQVIALLLKLKLEGKLDKEKALIVVPTTLLTNWQKEVEKFAPSLRTAIYHGSDRKLNLRDTDLLLTTYGMVRTDLQTLKSHPWHTVVIDEAQNIKNTTTDQTKAIKSIKSAIRIAMSGTPVENRLSEYWSIMDFVYPGYLGPLKTFSAEFADPIQQYHDKEKADLFRKITAPFILRRLKTDKSIISDLPEKIETNHYCNLTNQQAALYQNVVDQALNMIEATEGIQRKGLVLKMITSLKQICNHPDNFLKKGKADPSLSGKSTMLMELLENIHETGEKTLLFTQYREMGEVLIPMIENRFGVTPLFLHGGTTRKNRDAFVEEFQNKRNRWIFILSLKAGGTGLNLTAATHVIHHDFWWNPAVEAQATDRAYRIGQHKNVMVNRLLTQGTFEEKIDEMLKNKRELANLTVASGEQWIGELSDKDLKKIFSLEH